MGANERRKKRNRRTKIKKSNYTEKQIPFALNRWKKSDFIFLRPGTPTDNPHIESFNGSFRHECLNINWFMSLEDAKDKTERWRRNCHEFRPHSAFLYLTPAEFARKSGSTAVLALIFSY